MWLLEKDSVEATATVPAGKVSRLSISTAARLGAFLREYLGFALLSLSLFPRLATVCCAVVVKEGPRSPSYCVSRSALSKKTLSG